MEPQPGMKAGSRVIHASARMVNRMRTDTSANLRNEEENLLSNVNISLIATSIVLTILDRVSCILGESGHCQTPHFLGHPLMRG